MAEIGALAATAGKVIDIAVYGGSCLILVSNFRLGSDDVDAVAIEDQDFVNAAARVVAERRAWPSDWLNDGVRTYLSPNVDGHDAHQLFATYPSEATPGLRVFVPTAEYMLAMKLLAMRISPGEEKDLLDIVNLMHVVGLRHKNEIIDFAARFYPHARISDKLRLALDDLWRSYELGQTSDEPPRYLGRSGPPPDG